LSAQAVNLKNKMQLHLKDQGNDGLDP
jgi:hypothetical protein